MRRAALIVAIIAATAAAGQPRTPLTRALADSLYCRLAGCTITGDLTVNGTILGTGLGNVVGVASSVDGEIALFSGTGGKTIKRATGTGLVLSTAGVFSTFTSSATLAATIADESGSGALLFGTSPNITTPTGIVKGDVGLGNVDNTSDSTKNAAAVTLTNKTISGASNTISNLAASTIASGTLATARGGTNFDSSASTGVPRISAGTWTANAGVQHLAASTSADLRGVLSDETGGNGLAVFNNGPRLITPLTLGGVADTTIDNSTASDVVDFYRTGAATSLRVYSVRTDASNFSRYYIGNDGTGLQLGTYAGGSGVLEPLRLATNNVVGLSVSTTAAVSLPQVILASGTMTGSAEAILSSNQTCRSWTNANVTALGATTAGDISFGTLPANFIVRNAYIKITGAAAGPATVTVSLGRTSASYIDYIVASDAKAAANTVYGDASAERGTNLTGYDLPSPTGTTAVNAHFISTGANLSTVTGSTGTVCVFTEKVMW